MSDTNENKDMIIIDNETIEILKGVINKPAEPTETKSDFEYDENKLYLKYIGFDAGEERIDKDKSVLISTYVDNYYVVTKKSDQYQKEFKALKDKKSKHAKREIFTKMINNAKEIYKFIAERNIDSSCEAVEKLPALDQFCSMTFMNKPFRVSNINGITFNQLINYKNGDDLVEQLNQGAHYYGDENDIKKITGGEYDFFWDGQHTPWGNYFYLIAFPKLDFKSLAENFKKLGPEGKFEELVKILKKFRAIYKVIFQKRSDRGWAKELEKDERKEIKTKTEKSFEALMKEEFLGCPFESIVTDPESALTKIVCQNCEDNGLRDTILCYRIDGAGLNGDFTNVNVLKANSPGLANGKDAYILYYNIKGYVDKFNEAYKSKQVEDCKKNIFIIDEIKKAIEGNTANVKWLVYSNTDEISKKIKELGKDSLSNKGDDLNGLKLAGPYGEVDVDKFPDLRAPYFMKVRIPKAFDINTVDFDTQYLKCIRECDQTVTFYPSWLDEYTNPEKVVRSKEEFINIKDILDGINDAYGPMEFFNVYGAYDEVSYKEFWGKMIMINKRQISFESINDQRKEELYVDYILDKKDKTEKTVYVTTGKAFIGPSTLIKINENELIMHSDMDEFFKNESSILEDLQNAKQLLQSIQNYEKLEIRKYSEKDIYGYSDLLYYGDTAPTMDEFLKFRFIGLEGYLRGYRLKYGELLGCNNIELLGDKIKKLNQAIIENDSHERGEIERDLKKILNNEYVGLDNFICFFIDRENLDDGYSNADIIRFMSDKYLLIPKISNLCEEATEKLGSEETSNEAIDCLVKIKDIAERIDKDFYDEESTIEKTEETKALFKTTMTKKEFLSQEIEIKNYKTSLSDLLRQNITKSAEEFISKNEINVNNGSCIRFVDMTSMKRINFDEPNRFNNDESYVKLNNGIILRVSKIGKSEGYSERYKEYNAREWLYVDILKLIEKISDLSRDIKFKEIPKEYEIKEFSANKYADSYYKIKEACVTGILSEDDFWNIKVTTRNNETVTLREYKDLPEAEDQEGENT